MRPTLALKCLLSALSVSFFGTASHANEQHDGFRIWIERPWEFRYVISVAYPAYDKDDDARFVNRLAGRKVDPSLPLEVFAVVDRIAVPLGKDPTGLSQYESASLTEIRFDTRGTVLSPTKWPAPLSGHLSEIGSLILASGNKPTDTLFDIGTRYTGRSGEDSLFAPAVCTRFDMEGRYKAARATANGWEGYFGCREFGYYLRSEDHPYIDVTSYERVGPYIRPFIGWGRFDVPPKPVIGNHLGTWACLYECPDGEAPGIIADIKGWTAKHGWPLPKKPKKQPLFPDPPRSTGDYVD